MNEAETCRTLVRPKLEAAGWLANGERHFEEQIAITAGRVVVTGGKAKRQKKKISDFLLFFTRDNPLAVVEAKSKDRPAADGLQQAKEYARILGLMFAYSTNGTDIIEYDAFTKQETTLAEFPPAVTLWQRYQVGLAKTSVVTDALLIPDYFDEKRRPRCYQRTAIGAGHRRHRRWTEAVSDHAGDRHGKNHCRLPTLLETVECSLERSRRPHPQAPHPVPGRPQQDGR